MCSNNPSGFIFNPLEQEPADLELVSLLTRPKAEFSLHL